MTKSEIQRLHQSVWLFLLIGGALGILNTNNPYHDLSDIREFGCRWQQQVLNCSCEPQAPEFHIELNSIRHSNLFHLIINNCPKVRFGEKSINNIRNLRNIELKNIQELTFEESSLFWEGYVESQPHWNEYPTLKISIEKSSVERISALTFKGRISEIKIKDSVIKHTTAFAFTFLKQMDEIELHSVQFQTVEPQAFKKFDANYLFITNTTFGSLPSKTFNEINVQESFIIKDSSFQEVKSGAFIISNPKRCEILNSRIENLEGEGFKIRTRGDVLFMNNSIKIANPGGFLGFSSNNALAGHVLVIDSSIFDTVEAQTLQINTTSFTPKFTNIILNKKCECEGVEAFLRVEYLKDLSCLEGASHITMKKFKEIFCTTHMGISITVIIIIVCVVVLVVVVAILAYFFKKVYQSGEYGDKTKEKPEEKIIMPEGKTYRETEIMYYVERADLLTTDL